MWLSHQRDPVITRPDGAVYYVEYVAKWAQMNLIAHTGAEDLAELLNTHKYQLIVSYEE